MSIINTLQTMRKGKTLVKLDVLLAALVAAVRQVGKGGQVQPTWSLAIWRRG